MQQRIQQRKSFYAVAADYSFTLKIEKYVPFVCAAIHDGHQFRRALWENCRHTAYERWYEEDPATHYFIQDQPIVLAGRDSRFEYDLNRSPEKAVYEDAWGKKLWHKPLREDERKLSLQKHAAFYEVVTSLLKALTSDFEKVFIYDTHSYNWRRWERKVPFINLGTAAIDRNKFQKEVDDWLLLMQDVEIPNAKNPGVAENDVFQGKGYFLHFITQKFPSALILATEFSKLYCHELEQILYPEVIEAIRKDYQKQIKKHTEKFLSLP